MGFSRRLAGWAAAVAAAALLAACVGSPVRQGARPAGAAIVPGQIAAARLTPVAWQQVPGWQDDSLIGATIALRQNCARLARQANWQRACAAAMRLDDLDVGSARTFFETYFTPFQFANNDGTLDGLVTGYYEPLLHGSRVRRGPYQYALYRWPAGYRAGASMPARAQLMRSGALSGNELVWVDDPIEAFFLQVQGSGRVVLDDGTVMRVGYGGTNNQPYRSIGKWLLDHGELGAGQATMQGIKAWARANPSRVDALLDTNPRFVFFREMPSQGGRAARRRGRAGRRARRAAHAGALDCGRPFVDPARHAGVPADDAPDDECAAQSPRVRAGCRNGDQGRRAGRLFLGARRRRGRSGGADEAERTDVAAVSEFVIL